MWSILLYIALVLLMLYLGAATLYLLGLALAYLVMPERTPGSLEPLNSFAILVPAHNEELLIATLCESLQQIDYPKEYYEVIVIADNCTDRTAEICRAKNVLVLERYNPNERGKGQALSWGLNRLSIDRFDAIFIVDADNYVDTKILRELSCLLNTGEQAIQCYNAVGNRDDSWFTQLLFLSRTISNLLYHEAKYRLGLSSYLMGNGLCFTSELLRRRGWNAFTAGEDWECYAQLVGDNIKIGFAVKAKVFHQESRSLNQATSQRLRWSSGRFGIAKTYGVRLLLKGVEERSWQKIDASFPLIFPNYSLQINLTLVTLVLAVLLPSSAVKIFSVYAVLGLLAGQFSLFLAGAFIVGSPVKIMYAILYAPIFLIWKSVLDMLCLTGIYRTKTWVRTRRHKS